MDEISDIFDPSVAASHTYLNATNSIVIESAQSCCTTAFDYNKPLPVLVLNVVLFPHVKLPLYIIYRIYHFQICIAIAIISSFTNFVIITLFQCFELFLLDLRLEFRQNYKYLFEKLEVGQTIQIAVFTHWKISFLDLSLDPAR